MSEQDSGNLTVLGDVRAARLDDAGAWTPRDVLRAMLQRIDSGEIAAEDCLVIVRGQEEAGGTRRFAWSRCGTDVWVAAGMCQHVLAKLLP